MIVHQALIRRLLAGEKRQLRVPIPVDRVRCPYRPGRTYPVQTERGKDPSARVTVVSVHREVLGDITAADAVAEGHRSVAGFAAHWLLRYDKRWPPTERVACPVCVDAELEDACLRCAGAGMVDQPREVTDEETLARFQARFGYRLVWVVSFDLERAQPARFLHRDSSRGYTEVLELALPSESDPDLGHLEAVDDATLARFADDARRRHRSAPMTTNTRARDLARRVRQAVLQVGGDAPELDELERRIRELEARGGGRMAA